MNFVAINLAHEIVSGRLSVEQARQEYTRLYEAYQKGEHPPETERFLFELPTTNTADPDRATLM